MAEDTDALQARIAELERALQQRQDALDRAEELHGHKDRELAEINDKLHRATVEVNQRREAMRDMIDQMGLIDPAAQFQPLPEQEPVGDPTPDQPA